MQGRGLVKVSDSGPYDALKKARATRPTMADGRCAEDTNGFPTCTAFAPEETWRLLIVST